MCENGVTCTLKYLVKGIVPQRDSQTDLRTELFELLPNATAVTILPVVEGFSVEIEVCDLAPFSRSSFEPYIAQHVLPDAISIRCKPPDEIQLLLLKAYYR